MRERPVWLAVALILVAFLWPVLASTSQAQPPQPIPISNSGEPVGQAQSLPRVRRGDGSFSHAVPPTDVQSLSISPVATVTSIAELVARVDGARWHADVTTLAQFGAATPGGWGTRRTLTAGNLAARDWISATLASLGWTTSLHTFFMVGGSSYNVIGERTGDIRPDEIYIVGAHFDSTSDQAYTLAPGAEDNASGTAALLEIARVLQDQTPASTIRLIAFSGEEQGLVGSEAYAGYLEYVTHELDNVKGVYNMDMIGYTSSPNSLHVLLESRNPSTYTWMGDFRDHLASMAATYTTLQVHVSNNPCCSDHKPFLNRQVPAVLLIGYESGYYYPYIHTINDLPEHVVPAEGAEIIKAVVAALASKAGIICVFADVTCDGVVDVADLAELAGHWRLSVGQDGYEDKYDLYDDDTINILDLQLAVLAFTVQ